MNHDVSTYPIHILTENEAAFVQLLCKVVRLLIMMLENQDAVLTILLLNTTKDEHPPPPAVFLYLSSSINVVRSIQKDAEVFLSRVDAHFVAHAVQRSAVFRKNLIGIHILFIAFCGPSYQQSLKIG